ncbi:MAG: branched-chain amino acid ABC transporter permease [Acidobacteria bacterium]|nr:branched-chain amino acid ABC transporter permease [Acidobacteriota bacterium]
MSAVTVPFWANPGLEFLIGLLLIQALFAMSWNILFGYAGLASFGHAGFYAIGAYFTGALLRYQVPVPFPLMLVLAALIGAAVAWLIGILALRRLSGIFLAVLTVALSEILRLLLSYAKVLGAEDGLSNIPRPRIGLGVATLDLTSAHAYYGFLLVAVGLATAALWWLLHSRYGRTFQIIREDAERAAFLGTPVARYRVLAFMISGGVASFAGALYAPWARVVTLDEVNWLQSLQPMLYTLLGGAGSFWGPAIGAAAFVTINYQTRTLAGVSEVIVGSALLVIILVAPTGIVGLWHAAHAKWRARRGGGAR